MGGLLSLIQRNWGTHFPIEPAKARNALRVGLLGASFIAPIAIINPAKTHPEVIIAAIAARDPAKAASYAKKYSIPIVHDTYEALINDPSIDVIYVPLPNGLHYEWALKSLQAGKHVLLEKPSVSNATEAASLFRLPLLSAPNAPILLEAFHSRFHPAFQHFLSLVDHSKVKSAHTYTVVPRGIFPPTDIRFIHSLSGGCGMDVGTYQVLFLRLIFASEPEECISAIPRLMPPGYDQLCDQAMNATFRFPNGGTGSYEADLGYRTWGGIPWFKLLSCEAIHGEEIISDPAMREGEEHVEVKTVRMWNHIMPVAWHRIDIIISHTIRVISTQKILRKWEEKESVKHYGPKGKESWTTYRHQLEAFVNRIRKRDSEGGVWMSGEDSISQMKAVDSVYVKSGLGIRPTSEACVVGL